MIIKSRLKATIIEPEVKTITKEVSKKMEEQPKYKVVEEKPIFSEEEIEIETNLFDED